MYRKILLPICGLFLVSLFGANPVAAADPVMPEKQVDEVVERTIGQNGCPGAVVLAIKGDKVLFRKAYGSRSLEPTKTPMTPDVIFDMASLTKPIATATSIMVLLDEGKIKLTDPVVKYWPEFGSNGKDKITVKDLLLHVGGLVADSSINDFKDGVAKSWENIAGMKPQAKRDGSGLLKPGEQFIYSDMGFIALGELVRRISGKPLDEFAWERVFKPLGMNDTGYHPLTGWNQKPKERIAPTSKRRGDEVIVGEVHDPRAFALGGVAGHAGLFSTADDLARYVRMICNGGELDGKRILSPETVKIMTEAHDVPRGQRTFGWDMATSYSSNRGDAFPRGKSFGHTGFTGTSIWIDPASKSAVIILTNRVHPNDKGNVGRLRSQVATLLGGALLGTSVQAPASSSSTGTTPGINILIRDNFKQLQGRKVGLVTNHTGVDVNGTPTIDILAKAPGVTLVKLFSPEHGIRGAMDERVSDSKDNKTGLPIISLYDRLRKPDAASLEGIDTLVYDIQDIGCRFYTYSSTLGGLLESAAESTKAGKPIKVVVLDRPNPIGGIAVEGPALTEKESFVGWHKSMPIRHGLTVGELALLFNGERKVGADLEVIKMEGWRRSYYYDQAGLTWINPSPNMKSLSQAVLYPGIGLLEYTNLSVGRGTPQPFEWIGAPWLDGRKLAAALRAHELPGVRFVPVYQTPTGWKFRGERCGGVQIFLDDWLRAEPVRIGMAIAEELHKLYPKEWELKRYTTLLGNKVAFDSLNAGKSWREIEKDWLPGTEAYMNYRKAYLIYPD